MVDWKKLRSKASHKTMANEQLRLTQNNYVKNMLEIADKLHG